MRIMRGTLMGISLGALTKGVFWKEGGQGNKEDEGDRGTGFQGNGG